MKTMFEQAVDYLHAEGIDELERHAEVARRNRCQCKECFGCAASALAHAYRLSEHYEAAMKDGE